MIKAIIRIFLLFVILLIALIVFLLTPTGLKVSVDLAARFAPMTIQYQKISGTFLGPITIEELHIQDDQHDLRIKKIHWNWRLLALLNKQFVITQLHVNQISVAIPDTTPAPAPTPSTEPKTKAISVKEINHYREAVANFFAKLRDNEVILPILINDASIKNLTIKTPTKTITAFKTLRFNSQFRRRDFDLHLEANATKPTPWHIKIHINGNANHYQTDFIFNYQNHHWQAGGSGDANGIHLRIQKGHLLNGTTAGDIQLTWSPHLTWHIHLRAKQLNLKLLDSNWPALSTVSIQSDGSLKNNDPKFTASIQLTAPHAKVAVQLKHNRLWHAQWQLNVSRLNSLLPSAYGDLQSSGNMHGTLSAPITTGNIKANNLKLFSLQAQQLNSHWSLDFTNQQASQLVVTANSMQLNGATIKGLNLQINGKLRLHEIHLQFNYDNVQSKLLIDGAWLKNHWHATLKDLRLTAENDIWQLAQPTTINANLQKVSFTSLCLRSKQHASICVKGFWHAKQAWNMVLTGRHIPVNDLTQSLSPNMKITGSINLQGQINGTATNIDKLNLQAKLTSGTIINTIDQKTIRNPYAGGSLSSTLDNNGLQVQAHLKLNATDGLQATVKLPNYHGKGVPDKQQAITGHLRISFHHLKKISALIPNAVITQGALIANLKLAGTVGRPQLSGDVNIRQSEIKIPYLNITLKQLGAKLTSRDNHLNYTASATSAGKKLVIDGQTNLTEPGLPTTITIHGDNILVANNDEVTLYASPDLKIEMRGNKLDVKGSITVPRGHIKIQDYRNTVVLPENEIQYIGKPKDQANSGWVVATQVTAIFNKAVKIDMLGFKGNLDGKMNISGRPNQPIIATGRIGVVNGSYNAYGRSLVISKTSYIQYNSTPINNPSLYVEATKKINVLSAQNLQNVGDRTITVGVLVTGTARQPNVTLISTPPLSQADILSYLILGSPSGSHSNSNISLLLSAIDSLNLSKGKGGKAGGIVDQIKQGLGFSELGIEREAPYSQLGIPVDQRTSFVIGRHLTDRIYVRYSFDLTGSNITQGNVLTIRYLLNKNWAVQGVNSRLGYGGDILYTIEKN